MMPIRLAHLFAVLVLMAAPLFGSAPPSIHAEIHEALPPRRLLAEGRAYYRNGDMVRTAETLSAALESAPPAGPTSITIRRFLAAAHGERGFFKAGLDVLLAGMPFLDQAGMDSASRARYLGQIGDLYLSLGQVKKSLAILERAERRAAESGDALALAGVLNNRAAALELADDRLDAQDTYQEGIVLLQGETTAAAARIRARLRLNLGRCRLASGDMAGARSALAAAIPDLRALPEDHDTGTAWVAAGVLALEMADRPDMGDTEDVQRAFSAFRRARAIARGIDDPALAAAAAGHLGGMYETAGRPEAAMALTREAVFQARQGRFPEQLYRWQWRLGRLYDAQGNHDAAMTFLNRAVETLTPIRAELMRNHRRRGPIFRERIRPVYLDLARSLLADADRPIPEEVREERLRAARTAMETLKTAELEDFFQDPCVAARTRHPQWLDRTPAGAAVVYPIVFRDRIALLLTLPDGMRLETTPVDAARLEQAVGRFRALLQSPETGRRYFYYARRLHDWLIRPLIDDLRAREIRTLVIAPDGVLRLIPFAALHDGERFLSQAYGVVTVPGMTLTGADETRISDPKVLLGGLSEARDGFKPLPAVPGELRSIQSLLGGRVLLNDDYTIDNLTQAFDRTDYSVIHLATHGEFGGTSDATFLLTAEGHLTMDRLEGLIHLGRFRQRPVELLTLSACQTALGDARSALGLAGVAVKAGVQTAVATLWSVDDVATAKAVAAFYEGLRKAGTSKIEALQRAQAQLMGDETFAHPAYWSPFLLIGHWR